jgi:hypothetical protein
MNAASSVQSFHTQDLEEHFRSLSCRGNPAVIAIRPGRLSMLRPSSRDPNPSQWISPTCARTACGRSPSHAGFDTVPRCCRPVAGSRTGPNVRAAHGVHALRHHRRRRATELARQGTAMNRLPSSCAAPLGGQAGHMEHLSHQGAPAAFLGHVEAPDEEAAIKRAIEASRAAADLKAPSAPM